MKQHAPQTSAPTRRDMLKSSLTLAAAGALSDTILVMKGGRVVEEGPAERIFSAPQNPYTQALLAAAFDLTPVVAA